MFLKEKSILIVRLLLITCLFATLTFNAGAQPEYGRIQSGIIYYFTKYMVWSESKTFGNFNIYLVGNDDIEPFLADMVNDKKLAGVQSMKFKKVSSISEVSDAHIVYLSKKAIKEFDLAVESAIEQNFLLITALEGYGKKGSACNFVIRGGKPAYELNLETLSACKLKAGTKIKTLAVASN